MNRRQLASLLRSYFALGTIGGLPTLQPSGNIVEAPNLVAYLGALQQNASLANPKINYSAVTNVTTGALALTPANCANGIVNALVVCSGGSANTNTTDTATAILAGYWPGAYIGATALFLDVNLNTGTQTLAGGTGVTASGTLTIPTLAARWLILTCTNLANPSSVGAASTNSTTTTAAVATTIGAGTAGIIPVAASTGMIANASFLKWTNADGTTSQSMVTAINTLNITVADPISKAIASGAPVLVYNNALTMVSVCSTVTAIMAA